MLIHLDQLILQLLSKLSWLVEGVIIESIFSLFFVLVLIFQLEVPVFLGFTTFGFDELLVLFCFIEFQDFLSREMSLLMLELFSRDLFETFGFIEVSILFQGFLFIGKNLGSQDQSDEQGSF